jgi:hypothetical protein
MRELKRLDTFKESPSEIEEVFLKKDMLLLDLLLSKAAGLTFKLPVAVKLISPVAVTRHSSPSLSTSSFSHKNMGRTDSKNIPFAERGNLLLLCPMVILSQVPPIL